MYAQCSATLLMTRTPVLTHNSLGTGSERQSAMLVRMEYALMRSAHNAPATARNTPSPTFAAGGDERLSSRKSAASPSSSQGLLASRCCESHHPAIAARPAM